jgi:phosphonate transport system substrate-binding protein
MPRLSCRIILRYALVLVPALLTAGSIDSESAYATDTGSSPAALVLNVGLIPELNVFSQKAHYQPLMDYLSRECGITFKLQILPRYGNLIDNFTNLGLDAAFFGSFTGAMAIRTLGIVPLARPQFIGGRSTYYGMVFVRKDSGIKTALDMKGKRMVFVDRATTAGFLLPMSFFHQLGINNFAAWFKEYYFSGTHEDAIYEVLNGYADVGAAKNTIFYRLAAADQRIEQELEIIATSPPVPANSLAVRKDLPADLKKLIQNKLLTMHQNTAGQILLEKFGAEKFLATTINDYQPVLDYAADIGLDLATYQYRND